MSIEQHLDRIANALEKLAAGEVDINLVVAESALKPPTEETAKAPAETPPKAKRGGRKPKPAAAAPPAPTEPPAITADMVREALRIFLKGDDETLPQQAKAILEEFGSPSVTALDPQHFASVLGRLTGASA